MSGGQNQKIAYARALYKDAPIFILDEPTAALDALAEMKTYTMLNRLIEHKTAVYISHRLISTQFCNMIAMFEQGKLIEYGTHDELMKEQGQYYDMFHVQAKYYRD